MKINAEGWRRRRRIARDPRPSDTGIWEFQAYEGRLTLSTDGRYDRALDRFRKMLQGRRPQDISVN